MRHRGSDNLQGFAHEGLFAIGPNVESMSEIVQTSGVLGGEPRIAGRRVSVIQIVDMILDGEHSPEYVADQLDLSLADVHSALAYYYEHTEEMMAIRERHRMLDDRLRTASSSPEEISQ